MKMQMILNYISQIAQEFNFWVDQENWEMQEKAATKIKAIKTTANICGYKIEIWTEANTPKYIVHIGIEDEEGNIDGTNFQGITWYRCYKFKETFK